MTDVHTATKSLLSQVEPPNEIQTIDSCYRINNPINDEDHKPVNIVSMKEAIYELQKKKLSKEFAWDEDKEPLDIERNLTTVTLMDIECYDEFASVVIDDTQKDMPFQLNSPHRMLNTAALPPPPVVYNDKIDLLCHTSGGRGAELLDVAAALTAISSHDAFNLERVETLGDSFLKFISALYLYHKFPKLNEGQLTNIKSRLIGNRNLYYAAERINLGGRMKLDQFSPRNDFTLPSFSIPLKILECIEQSKTLKTNHGQRATQYSSNKAKHG
ncbi:Endoribonuclease Dcr-1 [Eumeta japonica]|uniref:Endoribonuclease Dcr-1 n=1 Tax=Eumeta variegata TaxID=151549 RepID=A0A4C1WPT2_EUMVA|nr:Endoribonuclease Dcr-1 [Eumeta japonica]